MWKSRVAQTIKLVGKILNLKSTLEEFTVKKIDLLAQNLNPYGSPEIGVIQLAYSLFSVNYIKLKYVHFHKSKELHLSVVNEVK